MQNETKLIRKKKLFKDLIKMSETYSIGGRL